MLQHQQNHKPQQTISPQSRRRASVARIVAEGERHLQNIRRQSPPSQHQHQSGTTATTTVEVKNHTHLPSSGSTTTTAIVAKPKTSIFDLDANLAHLRDTAIDLETKRDEVDPNIENLRAEELPPEMRRELKDIPEERAHQAHRARYREHWMIASPGSPSGNGAFASSSPSYSRMVKHEHTTNHHTSSPDHQVGSTTRFVSPPLRYDNNNVKRLSPNHNHHAIDRYSKAELSRGVQPDGVPVDSFFHSPHAVREKKLGERSIDEVLNEENYRITDAKRRDCGEMVC